MWVEEGESVRRDQGLLTVLLQARFPACHGRESVLPRLPLLLLPGGSLRPGSVQPWPGPAHRVPGVRGRCGQGTSWRSQQAEKVLSGHSGPSQPHSSCIIHPCKRLSHLLHHSGPVLRNAFAHPSQPPNIPPQLETLKQKGRQDD